MADKPLHDFVEEISGESHLRVEKDFGDGFVRLHTSEAERRQAAQDIRCSEDILLEVMRNAKDAHGTHIFIALSKEETRRIITIIDDGEGIPASMHKHVFEPRVTSKLETSHKDAWGLHGRGMALYSITVNADKAEIIESKENLGTSIRIETDTLKLPEKTDQSSFPTFEMTEEGVVNVRGPKNLLRCACEFAIEVRDSSSIYVGSPSEIASTLYSYGIATLSAIDRVFCQDRDNLPLVKRLATASDPADLAQLCKSIGLDISERTARRIMDGQIPQARNMLESISFTNSDKSNAIPRKKKIRPKNIRLDKKELLHLSESAQEAFSDIAESYYLEKNIEPQIRIGADAITISIPIVHKT